MMKKLMKKVETNVFDINGSLKETKIEYYYNTVDIIRGNTVEEIKTDVFDADGLIKETTIKYSYTPIEDKVELEAEYIKAETLKCMPHNNLIITDKGLLPISKIVDENIDCKVLVTENGKTKFANILERGYTKSE